MFEKMKMIKFIYSLFGKYNMNLNEHCLLNFLINPDEIKDLSEFFLKNIEEIEKTSKIDNN